LLGDDYTRRGKFKAGLDVDTRLAKLRPDDALVYYNLACSYSLTSQMDAAELDFERFFVGDRVARRLALRIGDAQHLHRTDGVALHPRYACLNRS
jgi:hypothetical protein